MNHYLALGELEALDEGIEARPNGLALATGERPRGCAWRRSAAPAWNRTGGSLTFGRSPTRRCKAARSARRRVSRSELSCRRSPPELEGFDPASLFEEVVELTDPQVDGPDSGLDDPMTLDRLAPVKSSSRGANRPRRRPGSSSSDATTTLALGAGLTCYPCT